MNDFTIPSFISSTLDGFTMRTFSEFLYLRGISAVVHPSCGGKEIDIRCLDQHVSAIAEFVANTNHPVEVNIVPMKKEEIDSEDMHYIIKHRMAGKGGLVMNKWEWMEI